MFRSCGVPQGSVLGPLLFLIYINDLPNISNKLNFYLFADDTHIYHECKSLQELEIVTNRELKKLSFWLNINRLSLNIEKTNYMIFHPYNKPVKRNVTILINKKAISEKDSLKYLGVVIDSTLSWKQHITAISKKISRSIGIMYKIRSYLPLQIMKNLYYSLIYSHIVYAIEVWGSAFKTDIAKILVLQKRALRLMTFSDKFLAVPGPLAASNPIFSHLKILKVTDIFKLQITKFVFKCINQLTPNNFHDWFKMNASVHGYRTRYNYDINKNLFHNRISLYSVRTSNYGLKQMRFNGAKIWNSLPQHIMNAHSLASFGKSFKAYYTSNYE